MAMSIDPAILKALQVAGATVEMIIAAVEADAAVEQSRKDAKRANNAERQRRFKAKNKRVGNADNALPALSNGADALPPSPNDIYSNPQPNSPEAKASCPQLAEKVVEAWNDLAARHSALSPARSLTPQRRKHLAARVKQSGEDAVFEAIRNVGLSDWHSGRKSDWHADLGWLLKSPENFQKLLEIKPSGAVPDVPKATEADKLVAQAFGKFQRGEIDETEFHRLRSTAQRPPPAARLTPQRTGAAAFGDLISRINPTGAHH